jgi:hypothetical protein
VAASVVRSGLLADSAASQSRPDPVVRNLVLINADVRDLTADVRRSR